MKKNGINWNLNLLDRYLQNKNNDGLKDRRILYAPMEYLGRIVPVMFIVKEYLEPQARSKLYAIEAIDFDL